MRIIKWSTIAAALQDDPQALADAKELHGRLVGQVIPDAASLRALVPSVQMPCGHVARFKIRGNRYRMLCVVRYRAQIMYVYKIGTHAEYDLWNLKEICHETKK